MLCSLGEKQKTSEIGTRKKGNEEKITLTPPSKTQPPDPHFPKKKKKNLNSYLFKNFIFDYWMANPPSRRFRKTYKPINHWTAWLPSDSLAFKAMTAWNSFKFGAIASVLRRQGRPDLAFMISSGWKVWKLYNNEKLDFHVFYCSRVANEIMGRLPASEREDFRMVWAPPKDSWG